MPSYLGSSFAFIAPLTAATQSHDLPTALGGVMMAGLTLALIGVLVQVAGDRWLRAIMPPMVTGAIVALIGLNLAPSAKDNFMASPVTGLVTVVGIVLVTVVTRTLFSRIAILVGVAAGYLTAVLRGEVDFAKVEAAGWVVEANTAHIMFSRASWSPPGSATSSGCRSRRARSCSTTSSG